MAGSLGVLVLVGETGFAAPLLGRSSGLVPALEAEAEEGNKAQTGHPQTSQQKNDLCITLRSRSCTCTRTCTVLLSSPLAMALLFSPVSGLEKPRLVVEPLTGSLDAAAALDGPTRPGAGCCLTTLSVTGGGLGTPGKGMEGA